MAKKIQYGRSMHDLLFDGMFFSMITSKIRDLNTPIEQSLLIHNLLETSPLNKLKDKKKKLNENLKRLSDLINPRIKEINSQIKDLNKMIKGLDFNYKIPELNSKEILFVVKNRMSTILEIDNAQNIGNDLFRKNLNDFFSKINESIFDFLKEVEKEEFEDLLEKIDLIYREGMKQSLNVCSIGYYTTSVFIAGRTVEELVNDYYKLLFKVGKIEKIDLNSGKFSFDNKINKLHNKKLISESTYHNLHNVRIDRNKFGHPSYKKISKKEAHLKINIILSEIPEIQKRMKK